MGTWARKPLLWADPGAGRLSATAGRGAAVRLGAGCEEAAEANADEATRQRVKQEPPEKLLGGYGHQPLLVPVRVIFPAEGDLAVGNVDDPVVGDRDAMRVAGQIVEDARKRPNPCGPSLRCSRSMVRPSLTLAEIRCGKTSSQGKPDRSCKSEWSETGSADLLRWHPALLTKNAALGREAENVTLKGRASKPTLPVGHSRHPTSREAAFPQYWPFPAGARQRSVNRKPAEPRDEKVWLPTLDTFRTSAACTMSIRTL